MALERSARRSSSSPRSARSARHGEPTSTDTAILLVDDHEENLLALEAVLEPTGYRLVRARSGDEALRALLRDEFAAILLDVQMPGIDGFETAELIRARERTRNVPIIFVTAISTTAEHVFRGYETGAVDYLFKPFDPRHAALEGRGLRRALRARARAGRERGAAARDVRGRADRDGPRGRRRAHPPRQPRARGDRRAPRRRAHRAHARRARPARRRRHRRRAPRAAHGRRDPPLRGRAPADRAARHDDPGARQRLARPRRERRRGPTSSCSCRTCASAAAPSATASSSSARSRRARTPRRPPSACRSCSRSPPPRSAPRVWRSCCASCWTASSRRSTSTAPRPC